MKRIITIISALLLVLSLSQCKKKPVVTDNGPEPVSITLRVNRSEKVGVDPISGTVTFSSKDKIYVASDGKYVGTLYYEDGLFSGEIIGATLNKKLYFYFLGNKTPARALNTGAGAPTSLTVDIIDQTSNDQQTEGKFNLPVISAGVSTEYFDGTSGPYTAILLNKCALVKFNVQTISNAATSINVGRNKVDIDLSKNLGDGSFTYGSINGGIIILPPNSSTTKAETKWAILLPQDDDEGGMAYTADLTYYGTRAPLKDIEANNAITTAINVNVNTALPTSFPTGAKHGLFSVADNRKVFFSQGNLQYIGSAGNGTDANTGAYWKFAENQYDYLGTTSGQNSADITVDRDLFGWATSGWLEHGNYFYQPYCTSNSQTDPFLPSIGFGYGPMKKTEDNANVSIIDAYANGDWGVCNRTNITYGGDVAYRTMTGAEWKWLLGPKENPVPGVNCRRSSYVNGTSNARFTYAVINTGVTTVKGLIIFPDLYLGGTPSGVTWGTINTYSNYTTTCDADGWSTLENDGCVFLPAAGRRDGTTIAYANDSDARGLYWASTRKEAQTAFHLEFGKTVFDSQNSHKRFFGYSVRLVTDF